LVPKKGRVFCLRTATLREEERPAPPPKRKTGVEKVSITTENLSPGGKGTLAFMEGGEWGTGQEAGPSAGLQGGGDSSHQLEGENVRAPSDGKGNYETEGGEEKRSIIFPNEVSKGAWNFT